MKSTSAFSTFLKLNSTKYFLQQNVENKILNMPKFEKKQNKTLFVQTIKKPCFHQSYKWKIDTP